tara:strand:+ start:10957 stop:11982 length:1026 start_codon:yes stop_codon:yes gene_type:complete
MSAGIAQLVCLGAQDEWISSEPEMSFFSSTYRRHTPFSQCVEKQYIQGAVRSNSYSSITLGRNGDLMGYTYFTVDDGTKTFEISDWTQLIESVQLVVGGQVIDEQTSEFSQYVALDMLAKNVSKGSLGPGGRSSWFYPLRFFFCEAVESALPICALQYQEVELRIRWGPLAGNYTWECHSNYYFLSAQERELLASQTLNMLIYQIQSSQPSRELTQELTFNHPVKFIASANTFSGSTLTAPDNRIKMSCNGTELSEFKWARPHFLDVSAYYHTRAVTSPDVFLYSFASDTSSLQPSGALNFSRVSSFKIHSESRNLIDKIYACSYNIFTIQNGIGALRFAN